VTLVLEYLLAVLTLLELQVRLRVRTVEELKLARRLWLARARVLMAKQLEREEQPLSFRPMQLAAISSLVRERRRAPSVRATLSGRPETLLQGP
jgi:hypothetical protein